MAETDGTPDRVDCGLGLASRGSGELDCEAVLAALDRGINYLNWCGQPDGMRDAIRLLGARREPGGRRLVAYLVAARGASPDAADLRPSSSCGDIKRKGLTV